MRYASSVIKFDVSDIYDETLKTRIQIKHKRRSIKDENVIKL